MRRIAITIAFGLGLLPACSDNSGSPSDCPAARPADGAGCALDSSRSCSYPLSKTCACGTSGTPTWRCSCAQGKWKCSEDADVCIPCKKDLGPDGVAKREAGARELGPDAAKKGCVPACKSNEVCVQSFDGTCKTWAPSCRQVSAGCLTAGCTPQCEKELCSSPFQCQTQVPCGTEQGAQINCYGS
jgi:hypothetical protein